jgi:hypothetical protein
MTREDAVSITSRLVALYFFCWTALSLSFFPNSIMAYLSMRQWSMRSSGLVPNAGHNEWTQLVNLILAVIRIAVGLVLALWFYRGGAKVRDFFLPVSSSEGQA